MVDGLLGQVRELAVVDGNVRLSARRICGAACPWHFALDLCEHLLHVRVVVLAHSGGLLI